MSTVRTWRSSEDASVPSMGASGGMGTAVGPEVLMPKSLSSGEPLSGSIVTVVSAWPAPTVMKGIPYWVPKSGCSVALW